MNPMLLQSYRIEFETTPITIPELCDKYDLTTKDLKGYTKWKKHAPRKDIITPQKTDIITDSPIESEESTDISLKGKIARAKELAVDKALEILETPSRFLEIKEFKDVVSVIDTLEKSTKDQKPEGNTTVVLIQNIMNSAMDDC
jgi:hypothetical protein